MSSSRSSRSKKPEGSPRVKLSAKETNGTDDDTEEDQIEINSEDSEDAVSSASDKPKKRKESSFNRSAFSMSDELKKLMERVCCCSCGKQLNPMNPGAIRKHPYLKVVTCKKCYKFLRSGPFTRDDDGIDEQCRWCGDGGRLYGCDFCHNCFCRHCIMRNMGRSEVAKMENDDGSKWHCYLCKPKQIRKLRDDCQKILGYIEEEDRKDKEKAERAKQREKEKLEKSREKSRDKSRDKSKKEERDKKDEKEKKDEKDKDKKDEKSTPKRGFPAPKDKLQVAEQLKLSKKEVETSKPMSVSQSAPDLIVVRDSPAQAEKLHHRAVHYKPDARTGVQHVQKISSGVTAVTVGPKNDTPVVVPFAKTKGGGMPRQTMQKPLLLGMLTTNAGPSAASANINRMIVKKMPPVNDMNALKNNIFPYNVEDVAEKMGTMTQSLNLTLNSIKTDIAIAKLSQSNMFQAKQMAASQMKNGLEYFFNNIRELLHVQITAQNPNDVPEDKSQGDAKPLSSSLLTSTPIGKQGSLVNSTPVKLNESAIPIEIDPSPVKKAEEKTEKMETDEDVVIVTDNDTKDVKVLHVSKDKVVKEEKINGEPEKSKDKENDKIDEIVLDEDSPSESGSKNESATTSEDKKDKNSENDKEDTDKPKDADDDDDKTSEKEVLEDSKADDVSEINDTDSKEKTSKSNVDVSENTAAELELLKEMADELNELEEKSKEPDQPRRSGRNKNLDLSEAKSESDKESPMRRSSRQRQKPEDDMTEKKDKRDKSSPEKGKAESKKAGKTKDATEEEDVSVKKDKNKKSGGKSKITFESEDESNDEEPDKKGKEKDKDNKLSNSKSKSNDIKDPSEDSDDNTEEEVPESKSSTKSNEKSLKKQTKSGNKSITVEESNEDTEDEIPNKKNKKSEEKQKKGSKKSSKIEKAENIDDMAMEDQVATDMSDTTESSDESVQEFGKRKKKRTVVAKEESSKRQTRQHEKKSENNTENSDSDPNFDSDLEKEIKSLSKSTKLTKKKGKESKDNKKEERKGKKEKSQEKEGKKGMKGAKDDISDLSSGDEEAPEAKSSKRRTRQSEKKSSENNTENSETDPDFDSDLEKEIDSLSKDTRLARSKAKESKESKKAESKGKKEKPKDKKEKKGKKAIDDDDSDLSSEMDEPPEEDDDSDGDTDNDISVSQLNKLKQAGKAVLEDESDDDDRPDDLSSDSSDDPEVSFPKLSTPKKGKKHDAKDLSEDSDFVTPKKKKKRGVVRDKLLDVDISDSGSETGKKGKGKKGKRKRKKADSDAFSEISDEEENRKKGKKRRRIKKIASSDEEKEEDGSDVEDDGTPGGYAKRKQIRKVIGSKKLTNQTKAAQKAEEERRKRIEERQKEYNTYVEVEGGESEGEGEGEEVPEGTEREPTTPVKTDSIAQILGSPRKVPVTTKCVLEMDKEKKKSVVEVDKTLIKKLKPHQVEAVRFMYNCCVESIDRLKKGEGSGCILAHCMGLGKTLSVITFVHTMLSNVKLTKMTKCLVVCPLNTCLNWVNEFEIWLDDVDFEIEVYEMSKVKQNYERAQMLKEWHEGSAAVMIMGYDMYRNLVNGSHCKNKKQKKIFYETLADPGPDIVVCDEGHILKNDATSLSKAMTRIGSRKRIVLTGTPLQNNLGEYHCMVSFVKPSLLGTRKEFNNRFCNPITNGQCSDSTPFDVKLMKRRAHILHELLAGCVQRKDYSALTKYLPPKFEYVISVRLAAVQMTLYEKYLEMNVGGVAGTSEIRSKGARLFTDYQALMRIWTHPWVLKLDEIRQENKRQYDDEDDDSFIQDSGSDEDSFVDDSTTSSSNSSDEDNGSSSDKKKKKKRTRGGKGSSSSDEDSKKENPDEVVKKWTSKRRGNEEGAGSSWMEDMGYANGPKEVTSEWWAEFVKEEDEFRLELSGKMTLMFEILKMCEDIGDKVLVFSQSLLSLDIIEDFLAKVDEVNNPINELIEGDKDKPSTSEASGSGEPKENGKEPSEAEKKYKEKLSAYGKSWSKGLDYFRMDGSTNSQNRKASQDMFNDPENYRARLFLISTKAGSLGINLVAANRVIIFDASWNPSHDIQSIFRVYRFGQVKPVYVYRFLAQGTMEEKIYERQVTKQSLSQRVVDEHQIERHFTSSDLQELYKFQPDRLDDPDKTRPLPILPKDHMLAELMTNNKEWIVTYHEHDSLLENVIEQELSEEEKKAAWEDYEDEKKGISKAMGGMQVNPAMLATQQMNMQTLLMQGQANLGQAAVLQIVQDLKARFPNLPPEVFQQRVQAVLRQVLTQQIMQQSEMQRRQLEQQRMNELNRLNAIKQQIQRQQAMISNQQRGVYSIGNPGLQSMLPQGLRPQTMNQLQMRPSNVNFDQQKK